MECTAVERLDTKAAEVNLDLVTGGGVEQDADREMGEGLADAQLLLVEADATVDIDAAYLHAGRIVRSGQGFRERPRAGLVTAVGRAVSERLMRTLVVIQVAPAVEVLLPFEQRVGVLESK